MSTKQYIKTGDTAEELKVVMKKVEEPVDGVTPPSEYWLNEKNIQNVYFSMAKIPQLQSDGSTLYPDGTIHNADGTILNPLGNPNAYISNIRLQPGEILNEDYSVTQTDGKIRYPSGLIKDTDDTYILPNNSILLPNGMVRLPATPPYPTGYVYNPGDVDRTNFYRVGNPTEVDANPDGTIDLPNGCTIDTDDAIVLPEKVMDLPSGVQLLSTTTVKFPSGTTKEESTQINRDNALILPKTEVTYPAIYSVSYNSDTRIYTFPGGSDLVYDDDALTAEVQFPNGAVMAVPYESVKADDAQFIFPYGTEHIAVDKKFIFPGETITLPLSATINVYSGVVSVVFVDGTVIDIDNLTATLVESNKVQSDGDVLLYDGSLIKLNDNHTVLYNDYEFYPRGTQKNSLGTIIHPDGYKDEGDYIRYYPTKDHPEGLLIRATDAAIVNGDGTFTKLDNSIVDGNGAVIQPASTTLVRYEATTEPPQLPVSTRTVITVVNHATGSYSLEDYPVSGSTKQMVVLKYQWMTDDTAHEGLYSGEFEITYTDGTKRTFPILKDDALFIEVLSHFSTGE